MSSAISISSGMSSHTTGSDIVVRNPPNGMPELLEGSLDRSNIGAVMTSMSLEGLGLDMSLEEAVNKVRELAKENVKLREDAQKNNQTMKQQYLTLSDWKNKWEQEREEVKKRHDQAKTVVTNLREELKKKEQFITELQLELAQQEEKKCQVTPSAKAELLTLEQSKIELERRCEEYLKQIHTLTEEIQNGKVAREENCMEIDKYIKIIRENENKIKNMERTTQMLSEEVTSLKKLKEQNEKFQAEKKMLKDKMDRMNAELEKYRLSSNPQPFDSMTDMGFVQITGAEESDAVPYDNDDSQFGHMCDVVRSAAQPQYPTKIQENTQSYDKPSHVSQFDEVKQKQEKTISDIYAQLQEEKNKVKAINVEVQQKNQEMEALHKKVHKTEELLSESEYKGNLSQAKMKVEHQKQIEELRRQCVHLKQELEQSRALTSSRVSLDSQSSVGEEDMKTLRVQVTSLVGELQEANDKYKATIEMYEKQKESIHILEAKVESQHERMEIQRAKDDELIETLRVTINNLECKLSAAREESGHAEKVRQDYTLMVQRYQELARQYQAMKGHLEQQKSQMFSLEQKKHLEQKLDNLTAQLMTAEESMQERNKKLIELEREKSKVFKQFEEVRAENDLVAVHKAQAEVYKADFDAERKAREEIHAEKDRMKEEVNQLIMRNQQLQEELDNLSQNQIAQMQLRHGTAHVNNQYNRFGAGAHGGDAFGGAGGGGMGAIPGYGYDGRQQGGRAEHLQPMGPPQHAIEQEEEVFECPKCGEQSPDLDSLQLHVLDCIV